MANSQKRKGDKAELEVERMLSQLLGINARRALGAGRLDDMGDIHGIPHTVIQVASHRNLNSAVLLKMPQLEEQIDNANARFGALFLRRTGGSYLVVQTPEQFAELWKAAQ